MEYQRLCSVDGEGAPVNKGIWIPYGSNPFDVIQNKNKPYYLSTFIYNDKQFAEFKKTGNVRFDDVTTDRLYWDFDCADDLNKAKSDAQEMCARLIQHGIKPDDILICFSGAKGFSVEIKVDKRLKPEEVRVVASKMAEGLPTFDGKMYNATRIFRVPETKHQKTGLYKTPLGLDALSIPIEEITKIAAEEREATWIKLPAVTIPESILELKRTDTKDRATTATIINPEDLDFKHKPKGFSNCKFAIMNGYFPNGERNHSLMILASTCRANGFPKEVAYNICKAAIRLQSQRYGKDPFTKEELWTQIIENIYGLRWTGGQYTCKTDVELKRICDRLGPHKCKQEIESAVIATDEVFGLFEKYATDFEKNALKCGIPSLDKKVDFMVGSSSAILAPPGVGKSSFAFNMLKHNSEKGINSLFFSYDMHHSIAYLRLLQNVCGLPKEQIFKLVKEKDPKMEAIRQQVRDLYKRTQFCFKSGQRPEDIEQTIVEAEEKIGEKVKLVVVDYSELVIAETSDPTQASAQVAQKLRQIANEREVALVTLYQPTKHNSNPAEEATSYQAAKGSGAIAQSVTVMLGLSRPGYNPRNKEEDQFLTVSILKNRIGEIDTIDLGWEGLRGNVYELSYEQEAILNSIRQRKQAEKVEEGSW